MKFATEEEINKPPVTKLSFQTKKAESHDYFKII